MTQTEALKMALEALIGARAFLESDAPVEIWSLNDKAITAIKEALAQPEQEKERCIGCEACIDTACGRDECPKGWPKAAQPEQEPTNLERHKRNVQKFLGTQQPKEPEQDEYLSKAYRLANELRCHLAIAPAPQRTWVGLTDEDKKEYVSQDFGGNRLDAMDWAEKRLKERNT